MKKKTTYFVSYVIKEKNGFTFHNGHVSPISGIKSILDIGKIEHAVENDRGLERDTVTIINYKKMKEEEA